MSEIVRLANILETDRFSSKQLGKLKNTLESKKSKKAIHKDSTYVALFRNGDKKFDCLCNQTLIARINRTITITSYTGYSI